MLFKHFADGYAAQVAEEELKALKADARKLALASMVLAGVTPAWIYDPDDHEHTYLINDKDIAVDNRGINIGEYKEFKTLINGPSMYVAHVALTTDEEGNADQTETQWFDTEEAAKAAVQKGGINNEP